METLVGKSILHYTVLKKLGAGGMGVVYEAEDTRLGRHVALKFLSRDIEQDPNALERFKREARPSSDIAPEQNAILDSLLNGAAANAPAPATATATSQQGQIPFPSGPAKTSCSKRPASTSGRWRKRFPEREPTVLVYDQNRASAKEPSRSTADPDRLSRQTAA